MEILICGYGNIGRHIYNELEIENGLFTNLFIFDKYKENFNNISILQKHYDFAFICVPTDNNENGICDTSIVFTMVDQIDADIIIIKSAVPVGTCEVLNRKKNIVCSPEYWGTTVHSNQTPNFLILGGSRSHTSKVAELYSKFKPGSYRFIFTDFRTAELAKYMDNCFIATKVTFCNEFAQIAKKFNVNYEELRECFVADKRVSPSHTFVYPDKPYYDSHCLNKDIPALIHHCDQYGIDTPLIDAVNKVNLDAKNK